MPIKEFNLLAEPWILATDINGNPISLSLIDVFSRAHEIKALSGELPTQDSAMLRLLLAVLYAAFPYVDEEGLPITASLKPVKLWQRLWNRASFPMGVIETYLQKYSERFWLFHPERPFWQVAGLNGGTAYSVSKLIGEISESSNKTRLFQNRSGESKKSLSYAEAARWLLYLNAYDDSSSKPTRGKKLPRIGVGWLGKLGFVYAFGNNLFETLMLNFVLLNNDEKWQTGGAIWELEKPVIDERREVGLPLSQAALLTLQSRRILLERENGRVTGYRLLGGDFFSIENAFSEQMTIWRPDSKKTDLYTPKRHNPSRQLWRDFSSLLAKSGSEGQQRQPGVVSWLSTLENEEVISTQQIYIRAASVQYVEKGSSVTDVWEDSISINAGLLSTLGDVWVGRITEEIEMSEKLVGCLVYLASDIAEASGEAPGGKGKRDAARAGAYYKLDEPFRIWLAGINPQTDSLDIKLSKWREIESRIILQLGSEMAAEAGSQAFVGRYVKTAQGTDLKTTAQAYSKFKNSVKKLIKNNEE